VGGSGSATSLKERIRDTFFSHLLDPMSLDPSNEDVVYVRLLSRNADRGDAVRRVLMRDAGAIGREMLGDAERALPPRRTGIILDNEDIVFCYCSFCCFCCCCFSSLVLFAFLFHHFLGFASALDNEKCFMIPCLDGKVSKV
jgi:hypothetical protein